MIYAKVIADSINDGNRITTVEVKLHRYVLSEFNTHRVFSRNSASSRARPVNKIIQEILGGPAFPIEFGTNKPGMQAGEPLTGVKLWVAKRLWKHSAKQSVRNAKILAKLGVHKQVTNRILEPYMWHTIVVTSTEWENFFKQRCSPLAQPEIRAAAEAIREAINQSTPVELRPGDWHTPYIQEDERKLFTFWKVMVSAARCARVSYLTHDGKRLILKDIELFEKLTTADPPHWSPLEHVATPVVDSSTYSVNPTGNFTGWGQLRHNLNLLGSQDWVSKRIEDLKSGVDKTSEVC